MVKNILLVDDEVNILKILSAVLTKSGNNVISCNNANEALERLEDDIFDLMITDLKMPDIDGLELLKIVHEKYPDTEVIMITAHGTIETAVEAMKRGAIDYLLKPFDMEEIKLRIQSALNTASLKNQEIISSDIQNEISFNKIIGNSKPIQEIFSIIKKVACTDSIVLIMGESGTGKELIARGIHDSGQYKNEPFIGINCSAIPENLLESELFGYEKGAFTGASERRKGRFELAGTGTLFLDEIGDMNPSMQVKLLRVLQERAYERVGGSNEISLTARIITATNKNLEVMVKEGKFREDLYYRLNVIPIFVPPLRNRKEDIEILIDYFINYFCKKFNRPKTIFTAKTRQNLCGYNWPGNIRELGNIIERILVLNNKKEIDIDDLPLQFRDCSDNNEEKSKLKNYSQTHEREIINKYLKEFNNNRTKTAEALGINRRTLLNKIKEYGIQ